jgi:hypothetical protein
MSINFFLGYQEELRDVTTVKVKLKEVTTEKLKMVLDRSVDLLAYLEHNVH